MNKERIIYLDIDGVSADFVEGVGKLFGYDGGVQNLITSGNWNFYEDLDIYKEDMWEAIKKAGVDFWANLPDTNCHRTLYNQLGRFGRVIYLSSPACFRSRYIENTDEITGKLIWLRKRRGNSFKGFVFTPDKSLLARYNTILIDDNPKEVEAFKRRGGEAILLPQVWNIPDPSQRYMAIGLIKAFTTIDIVKKFFKITDSKQLSLFPDESDESEESNE